MNAFGSSGLARACRGDKAISEPEVEGGPDAPVAAPAAAEDTSALKWQNPNYDDDLWGADKSNSLNLEVGIGGESPLTPGETKDLALLFLDPFRQFYRWPTGVKLLVTAPTIAGFILMTTLVATMEPTGKVNGVDVFIGLILTYGFAVVFTELGRILGARKRQTTVWPARAAPWETEPSPPSATHGPDIVHGPGSPSKGLSLTLVLVLVLVLVLALVTVALLVALLWFTHR